MVRQHLTSTSITFRLFCFFYSPSYLSDTCSRDVVPHCHYHLFLCFSFKESDDVARVVFGCWQMLGDLPSFKEDNMTYKHSAWSTMKKMDTEKNPKNKQEDYPGRTLATGLLNIHNMFPLITRTRISCVKRCRKFTCNL